MRERVVFQGTLCSPHKSDGFCGNFGCNSKGYGERETSFTLLEREGVAFSGLLCSPLKSGGFCGNFGCTSKGYGERETSLASLEREVVTFSGLALLASQKWWILMQFWVHQ